MITIRRESALNCIAEQHGQVNRALRHSRAGGKARQVAPHPHKTQPTALSLLYVTSSTSITQTSIPPKHTNQHTTQACKPVYHPSTQTRTTPKRTNQRDSQGREAAQHSRKQINVTLKAVRHKELCNYPAYQGRQDNHITH